MHLKKWKKQSVFKDIARGREPAIHFTWKPWTVAALKFGFIAHTKWVDNSGSVTTVLVTKYLYNDAKCLFLSERWVLFLTCWPSLLFWSCDTNRPISTKKMFFWDYCPAQPGCSPCKKSSFGTTAVPAGCSPMGLCHGPGRASPILHELENQ